MKYAVKYILVMISIFGIISACSELKDDLSAPAEVSIHKTGFADANSPDFHSHYFKEINWDLRLCAECHGSNYAGGLTSLSCLTCHTGANGPEACNTCHGDFANPENIKPPADLEGNITTDAKGVGAHQQHNFSCFECHLLEIVEGEKFVYSHIGQLPADLSFGEFAASGVGTPEYNFTELTCSNVYCHGAFEFEKSASQFSWAYTEDKMEGNNFSPKWNQVDGTQAACGTCHGLPPTGHVAAELTACVNCHPGVVDGDGNIIDETKHINGDIDVF